MNKDGVPSAGPSIRSFSHPDYTVGSGIAPDPPQRASDQDRSARMRYGSRTDAPSI